MIPDRFVFWQPQLSIHESAHCRALADMGYDVTVVAAESLSEARRSLGWQLPNLRGVQVEVCPNPSTFQSLVHERADTTLHLIVGTRGWKLGADAVQACAAARSHIALIQEGGDPRGVKGKLRTGVYAFQRITQARHTDFLLAMGDNGVRWYSRSGWPAAKLFPYAYWMERPTEYQIAYTAASGRRLLFIGQLIERKGLDVLLRALAEIKGVDFELSIVGDGPARAGYQALRDQLGLQQRVSFEGVLSNSDALARLDTSDLLIVPSRFDGWAAVISEALMRGTPVVCSRDCGAEVLVRHAPGGGKVARAGSVSDFATAIQELVARDDRGPERRARLRAWASELSGDAAARYLLAVMAHVYEKKERPEAPWAKVA